MRTRKYLPEMTIACAVVQCAIKTDRRPIRGGGRRYDFCSHMNLPLVGREGLEDRPDLVRMDAPHARVAELAGRLLRGGAHRVDVVELGDHAMRRHLAVRVRGRGDVELGAHHQRMRELPGSAHALGRESRRRAPRRNPSGRSSATGRADGRRCRRHGARPAGDSISTCSGTASAPAASSASTASRTSSADSTLGTIKWLSRWPARPAMVTTSPAKAGWSTGCTRTPTRMPGRGSQRQFGDQRGMLGLAAHRGAVFAVERDVEHAGAELLGHLGLQRQALAHARFDAAVVVAHRQHDGTGLRAEQHVAWMRGGSAHALRCATMNMRGKASRRLPSVRTG